MQSRRIVITDVGIISALGVGFSNIHTAMAHPQSKVSVKDYEFHQFEKEIPCFGIRDFDPVLVLGKKGLRTKDNSTKLLLGTFETALKDVMESLDEKNHPGICIGTAFGSVQSIGDFLSDSIVNGVNNVNPQAFANTVINSPTGNANIRFLARNLSATISTGFNSGIDALIYAFDHMKRGYLSRIVAGGLEEISYYSLLGLSRTGLLSLSGNIRPFASDSDGIVMGEGCAIIHLETEDAARERNALIQAEILAAVNGFDPEAAFGDSPKADTAATVIRTACQQAGVDPQSIDFIASSANGNRRSDRIEAAALNEVFGKKTPITTYKAFTGDCYGASGAIITACALSDLKNGTISGTGTPYKTLNDLPVVFETIKKNSSIAMVTSVSCDGNCSAVILKNR
ncbi:MAG TPA: beta-ketoacyl synthase N-terminal-like domain-containing protein [Chitinispirillaceae bacterium]|nr:beta-ketoacyl synthase N-terminal-like domain-containing protein [Chitinispirillaceae bacterium]